MTRLVKRPFFSLKQATLLNWGNLLVHTSLGFVITPIVLKTLGAEGFGIWAVILSISGYYGLANLGLGSALGRFVTRDVELDDLVSLQTTLDAATVFFTGTGLLVVCGVWVIGDSMAGWLRISSVSPAVFSQILLVASVGVIADFYKSINSTVLAAAERYDINSLLVLGQRISQAIGTVGVVLLRPGVLELVTVITANTVLFQLLAQSVARRTVPGLRILPRGLHFNRMSELLRFGSGSILISVANLVRLRLGSILIARYANMVAVTNFTIATNLITNFNAVISSSSSVIGVRFTKLDASNSLDKLHETYRMSLFATSLLTFGIGALMFVFADRFIIAWLGEGHEQTVSILHVLVPAYILSLCQGPGWNMMFARAKHHALAWVMLGESVANICLGVFLLRDYGALGFAWSTAITMGIVKLTFQPWYAARVAQLPLRKFLEPMLFPALFGIALILGAEAIGLQGWLRTKSFLSFLAVAACFGAIYAGSVLLLSRNQAYLPRFIDKPLRGVLGVFGVRA